MLPKTLKNSCKLFSKHVQSRPTTRIQTCLQFERRFSTDQSYISPNAQRCMDLESIYGANNYSPIPCVISKGLGCKVWDVDGNEYLDFLAAYGAVNQGHSHPKIINTMIDQVNKVSLTSRAFYNDILGEYCEFVTNYFNYKRLLPMNSGVEACESAIKIARKWAYQCKNVPKDQARVCFVNNNFWGRSIAAISASTDPESFNNYGPFTPLFDIIEYNSVSAVESYLSKHGETTAAFMMEPVQGEAGVVIPDVGYLSKVRDLCRKHNVLLICDEVQAGLGRCGSLLSINNEISYNNHLNDGPDLITLGKALSGGIYPVSAVLARTDEIMDVLTPGTHGSTYGGNPLGSKIAITALNVLNEENLIENSMLMGNLLLNGLNEIYNEFNIVKTVRGRGLFCAIEIHENKDLGVNAWNVCIEMMKRGILAKPTHDHIIRLSPPLVVSKKQIEHALDALRQSLKVFEKINCQ